MIQFDKEILSNGLTVLVHQDFSSPLVAMNILYKAGARDEHPDKTGFAHLFEHLMFGGSINIPSYDEPLQKAGGDNNAFTSNDFTNYYLTIPANNIETAFWLESDRMLSLAFNEKSLEVQRNVVVEEFKQRYLNQPYGDAWLQLRPLAYKVHPYQWATIGKDISHIENASLDDVKMFFNKYYLPNNAILCLSGAITTNEALALCKKWFQPIAAGKNIQRNIPVEPQQNEKRIKNIESHVPVNALYKAYHCCARNDADFYATDILTDVLSRGKSSRLYTKLVKEQKLFSNLNMYMLGEIDKSMVVADGKINPGITHQEAEDALTFECNTLIKQSVEMQELQKIKQQVEAGIIFGEMGIANKALNLCYYEMLGNAADVNQQAQKYLDVTTDMLMQTAKQIFNENNASTLYYHAIQS
ncbi:MAG: insulinase family protein [Bacteroidia bacterium]|nr:insulinase family protein [Bacteroidia bacterium]